MGSREEMQCLDCEGWYQVVDGSVMGICPDCRVGWEHSAKAKDARIAELTKANDELRAASDALHSLMREWSSAFRWHESEVRPARPPRWGPAQLTHIRRELRSFGLDLRTDAD